MRILDTILRLLPYQRTMLETDIPADATLAWQRALKFAGFYRGQLDGITGPLTREAAAQWRESHQQLQTRYGLSLIHI